MRNHECVHFYLGRVEGDVSIAHRWDRNSETRAAIEPNHGHIDRIAEDNFRGRGEMNPALSNSDQGAPSYLKVGFMGFKEFGSGDGPLPQSPGFVLFSQRYLWRRPQNFTSAGHTGHSPAYMHHKAVVWHYFQDAHRSLLKSMVFLILYIP